MSGVRVRFAPSPTGDPHIGSIRTVLFNWIYARHTGGVFILRIEDTDTAREQEGSAQTIMDSLAWLGLNYDEGPGIGGPHAPYFQSQRRPLYQPLIQQLLDSDKAYRCYCSKERLAALTEQQQLNKQATGYDRKCRDLSPGERAELEHAGAPFTVRLKMPLEGETRFRDRLRGEIIFQNNTKTDPVLVKADGMPVYHFAHVVDDHLMGITHVLRAEEWISSTPIHVLLYDAFGWDPPQFIHIPLVLDMDGKKLSKRRGHAGTLEHRDEGFLPEALFNFLALLGWSPGGNREIMSREEIVELFSLDGLLDHSARFDRAKLEWMNGEYIRKLSPSELLDRCEPFLVNAGLIPPDMSTARREYAIRVTALQQDRLTRLSDAPEAMRFFFEVDPAIDEKAQRKWLERSGARRALLTYAAAIERMEPFDAGALEDQARRIVEEIGCATGELFHPARVAVSGRTTGPGLFEMMAVMGRDTSLHRLRRAAAIASE
ncbi:MAG TPA: glutamate--tRNA ligase [Armatimonadota bacterium]|nr:glutamate--tRNA ligase [Armatimonadota bacterium]